MHDIYGLMKSQLQKNSSLLLTYFNIMILSKAFKLNKGLFMTSDKEHVNNEPNTEGTNSFGKKTSLPNLLESLNAKDLQKLNIINDNTESSNLFSPTTPNVTSGSQFDYDADIEMSFNGKHK